MRSKGGRSVVPFAAYYSAREEGTMVQACRHVRRKKACGAPACLHHVTGVFLININIGKFHCRVTCQCGPAAAAKLQLPSCLDRLG